jgi:hypothetical protein
MKCKTILQVSAAFLLGAFAVSMAGAQNAPAVSLADQLKAQHEADLKVTFANGKITDVQ